MWTRGYDYVEDTTSMMCDRDKARARWPVVIVRGIVVGHVKRRPRVAAGDTSSDHALRKLFTKWERARAPCKKYSIGRNRETIARASASTENLTEQNSKLVRKLDAKASFQLGHLRRSETRVSNIAVTERFFRSEDPLL